MAFRRIINLPKAAGIFMATFTVLIITVESVVIALGVFN
jgi:hypothetical protein